MFDLLKCSFLFFSLFIEINCVASSNKWQNVIDSTLAKSVANTNYEGEEQSRTQYNDQRCRNDVLNFYQGIDKSEKWAVKMFDSWGNAPSGILSGNVYNLGSFDGCVEVERSTQYCLLQIEISGGNSSEIFNNRALTVKPEILDFVHPMKMLVGTCYPSTCSPEQTAALYETFLNLHDLDVQVNPSGVKCYINERDNGLEFSEMQIIAIIVFSLIAILIVSSTVVDFFVHIKETNVVLKVWKAFSAYKNLPKLCDTQVNSKDDELKFGCLDGLRVISMIWIAYGHSVLITHRSPLINTADIIPWSEKLWSIMSWSTFVFAMDTSFVIGGFLATTSIQNQLKHDHRPHLRKFLSMPRMWLHRYIRLAPAVIAALLFFPVIGIKLGKGPFWNSTMQEIELCYDNWWSTLLFIQNFASPGKMCLGHLWYLAIDFQMYIVTTILLFLTHWKGTKFLWIAVILVLGNIFNNLYWFFMKDFQWIYGKEPNTVERDALTYYRFRVTSWLIGVALAIVYAKYLKKRELFKMSSKVLVTAYAYCVVVVALIVWNLSYMTDSHVTPSTVHNALFDSFSRLFWASAIALIIFICISKNGGPVNRILAAPIWRPLAKLSFCIYVLNYDIQVLKLGRNRTTVYMNNITLVDRFWSDFGMSATAAVIWTLAFEMPFRIIERIRSSKSVNLPIIIINDRDGSQGTALTN